MDKMEKLANKISQQLLSGVEPNNCYTASVNQSTYYTTESLNEALARVQREFPRRSKRHHPTIWNEYIPACLCLLREGWIQKTIVDAVEQLKSMGRSLRDIVEEMAMTDSEFALNYIDWSIQAVLPFRGVSKLFSLP